MDIINRSSATSLFTFLVSRCITHTGDRRQSPKPFMVAKLTLFRGVIPETMDHTHNHLNEFKFPICGGNNVSLLNPKFSSLNAFNFPISAGNDRSRLLREVRSFNAVNCPISAGSDVNLL